MGLMLSVLVFCVGVVEGLDCWRHLLLHVVQPQYNPLPCCEGSRDDLTGGEHLPPSEEELRITSHVDICWPKDLSPDDVHVLKKRKPSDSERERYESEGLVPHTDHRRGSPQIVVHAPETKPESPLYAKESSPNHLELSVIIESDSSSEIDEPSQIENPAYRRNRLEEASSPHLANKVIDEVTAVEKSVGIISDCDDDVFVRESCPSAQEVEDICDYESELEERPVQGSPPNPSEPPNVPDLPVFTDNIISQNVMKVSCRYPSGSSAGNINTSSVGVENHENNLTEPGVLTKKEQLMCPSDPLKTELQSPEIRLSESSPLSLADSSDSSMSTGDASAMVKSKTSDRPLVVVSSKSSKSIEDEFISVTKTDLQALGKADSKINDTDVYHDAQSHEEIQDEPKDVKELSKTNILDDTKTYVTPRSEGGNEFLTLEGGVEEKKTSETNSSSSSLSGIPQLPEDSRGSVTPLPTDNGYGNEHSGVPKESCDSSDCLVDSLPTDDSSKHHVTFSLEVNDPSSEDRDVFKSEQCSPNVLSRNTESDVPSEEAIEKELKSTVFKHKDSLALPRVRSRNASTQSDCEDLIETSTQTEEVDVKSQEQDTIRHSQPPSSNDTSEGKSDTNAISKTSSEVKPTLSEAVVNCQAKNTTEKDHFRNQVDSIAVRTNPPPPESKKSDPAGSVGVLVPSTSEVKPSVSEAVFLCQAKKTSEEDHVRNRADSITARTSSPPPESKKSDPAGSVALSGPSTSGDGATASTSKAEHPENKAFWLIFSGEYTKAMNKDWHSGHFCCWQCDESLTGQRYVLRDEHPYCIKCYESVFANGCEECSKTIGIDSKDLSYKDKHWHEACFLCNKCRISLVDKQFGSKLDKIFCGNCYDTQFASRCDGCGQIFKAGTKKMEYKTRQWHEPCFSCCVCKSAIGTKSFIPREQEIYCATCYEEKFATRCVKCNKIITSGGVTYKNEPWHRECFTCTNCNTSLAGQRFTSRDEKPYCADCFGELFAKRCTACCKPITGIGGTRFISFEDRHWHNDCFICASCKTSLVGRGFITDADDIICPECAKQKLM